MLKLERAFLMVILFSLFVSCEKEEDDPLVHAQEEVEVTGQMSLKSARIDPEASGVNVWIKWIDLHVTSNANPSGKDFHWDFEIGSGIEESFDMKLNVGENHFTGTARTYTEGEVSQNPDPQYRENDGVSSGGDTDEAPFPGRKLNSTQILSSLEGLYPDLVFTCDQTEVIRSGQDDIRFDFETTQGRIRMTYAFASDCHYYAVVRFKNERKIMGGDCPDRTFGPREKHKVAWLYWSNNKCQDGTVVPFYVDVYCGWYCHPVKVATYRVKDKDLEKITVRAGVDKGIKVTIPTKWLCSTTTARKSTRKSTSAAPIELETGNLVITADEDNQEFNVKQ